MVEEQQVEVERSEPLLALDGALERFEVLDADKARLVKLRYFAGMTIEQAAELGGGPGQSILNLRPEP